MVTNGMNLTELNMTNFFMFFHHLMTPQRETFDWVLFSRINHVVHLNYGVPDICCLKALVFDLNWSFFAKKKILFQVEYWIFQPPSKTRSQYVGHSGWFLFWYFFNFWFWVKTMKSFWIVLHKAGMEVLTNSISMFDQVIEIFVLSLGNVQHEFN